MDQDGLKEELRKHALEMVERVSAKMPGSLRRFRQVERALKEEMEGLSVKCLQSWCDQAKDDSSRPLCPPAGVGWRRRNRRASM